MPVARKVEVVRPGVVDQLRVARAPKYCSLCGRLSSGAGDLRGRYYSSNNLGCQGESVPSVTATEESLKIDPEVGAPIQGIFFYYKEATPPLLGRGPLSHLKH